MLDPVATVLAFTAVVVGVPVDVTDIPDDVMLSNVSCSAGESDGARVALGVALGDASLGRGDVGDIAGASANSPVSTTWPTSPASAAPHRRTCSAVSEMSASVPSLLSVRRSCGALGIHATSATPTCHSATTAAEVAASGADQSVTLSLRRGTVRMPPPVGEKSARLQGEGTSRAREGSPTEVGAPPGSVHTRTWRSRPLTRRRSGPEVDQSRLKTREECAEKVLKEWLGFWKERQWEGREDKKGK